MCRIASLFLLHRLKGSMSGDTRDLNNIETRAVIMFFFLQGKAPKEIRAILTEILREHAPSYATVKNWVAQFKCGDFSTCDVHRPGWHKTVTTPEIIDQIQELILENHWILAKSIAEQLGISREWVGSIIHEDLDMQKLSAKWVPKCLNADKNVNSASCPSNFWNFFGTFQMIPCRNWWPWRKPGYITMTRRQSNNQWGGGMAAHPTPKNSKCKDPLENFLPLFFGIKMASSSLSSKGPSYQCGVLLISAGAIERTFGTKNTAGRSPRGSCSCTTMPRLTGHLQPRRNWPTWASSVLITHPILWIWPCQTTTCSLDSKNNWKFTVL